MKRNRNKAPKIAGRKLDKVVVDDAMKAPPTPEELAKTAHDKVEGMGFSVRHIQSAIEECERETGRLPSADGVIGAVLHYSKRGYKNLPIRWWNTAKALIDRGAPSNG